MAPQDTATEIPTGISLSVFGLVKDVLWPRGLFGKIGRGAGVLSILALIDHAFDYDLAATVAIVVAYYDQLVTVAIGWATPHLQPLVSGFGDWLGLTLTLYPHWKHIFVLLCVYFLRSAHVNYEYGYPGSAVFCSIVGIMAALATSVAAGTVSLEAEGWIAKLCMTSIPIIGIFVFDFAKQIWNATFIRKRAAEIYRVEVWGWWEYLRPNLQLAASQGLGSIVIAWAVMLHPWMKDCPSPSIVALGAVILAIACFRVGLAIHDVPGLINLKHK